MSKKYKCPVCGFIADSKHAVQGHILGMNDLAHKELRGPGLWERIVEIDEDSELKEQIGKTGEEKSGAVITLSNSEDIDLLNLTDKLPNLPFQDLQQRVEQIELEIEQLKKRLDVHKEVLLKILKALGVE